MATTKLALSIESAGPIPSVTLPELKSAGSAVTVLSYSFDSATTEGIQWQLPALLSYGSGNLTVKCRWYADTATTGGVAWGATIEVVTPADALNMETGPAWNTEALTTGTASGTAHGLVETSCTVSSLDSLTNGDVVFVRIRRKHDDAGDDMSGDAQLVGVVLEYSDT